MAGSSPCPLAIFCDFLLDKVSEEEEERLVESALWLAMVDDVRWSNVALNSADVLRVIESLKRKVGRRKEKNGNAGEEKGVF